jgi:uncharacterized membrane protein YcaP (DUF421 family)
MFDLEIPVWELMVRAAAVYLAVLAMVRITGKRTVGQFTPFDLLVVMLMSEAVGDSLRGGDKSLVGGLIACAVLVVLDVGISLLTSRSRKADEVLQGAAVLIGRDGAFFKDVLRKERVPEADVEKALRSADCTMDQMRIAVLEADGSISILKQQG